MRTSNVIASIALLGIAVVGIALSPAVSFDGTRPPEGAAAALPEATPSPAAGSPSLGGATPLAAVPAAPAVAPLTLPPRSAMPPTPQEAFRSGTQLLRQGKTEQAIMEFEYAAEQGVPGAIWKLGRMYADGDGVKADKARAYEYFRRLTTMHGDDSASAPNARFVANAFVTRRLVFRRPRCPVLPRAALPPWHAEGRHPGGAVVAAVCQQGRSPGAGSARQHAVQGRGRVPPSRARVVLAHRRQGRRQAG